MAAVGATEARHPIDIGGDFTHSSQESKNMAEQASLSGLTEQQAKEFHEQFKTTYTAFVGIAALVHLMVIAANPWF